MVIIFSYNNLIIYLDEWLNPSGYDIAEVATSSIKKCFSCAALGVEFPAMLYAMLYCDRCSATTKYLQAKTSIVVACTRCVNGYLAANKSGCVTSCQEDDAIISGGTFLAIATVSVDGKN